MEDYKVLQTGDEIQEILNQAPVDTADIAELKEAATSLDGRLEAVEGKIPSGASSENPLTDKQYVDSSIASASATFRGTYNEVTDLELTTEATHAEIGEALSSVIDTADSNDYCFVQIPTADATPTEIESIERYKFVTGTGWQYEYTLNNSGFTADQWAAINSGITSGLVAKLTDLPTNAELNTLLNGKANAADVYTKSETYTKTEIDTQLGAKANSADVYPKTDTYTKQEVDALITTPEVQYVTVTATSGTTSVTDVLPATGAANTIYRVGSWDGTQYATGVYSEYAWNGTTYILLDVKNYGFATGSDFDNPTTAQRELVATVGSVLDGISEGVFDLTAKTGYSYATLADALTAANTSIPTNKKKGGMSIKFVQSSDNKYVQARCMAQNFTTNVADWQGVDNIPTPGSKNMIESGAVAERFEEQSIDIRELDERTENVANIDENEFALTDSNGNIGLKYDEDGLDALSVNEHLKDLIVTDEKNRAEAAEAGLNADIANESNRAKIAESDLAGDIGVLDERTVNVSNIDETAFAVVDSDGNACLMYGEEGLDAEVVSEHFKGLVVDKRIEQMEKSSKVQVIKEDINGVVISDADGNVGWKIEPRVTNEDGIYYTDSNGNIIQQIKDGRQTLGNLDIESDVSEHNLIVRANKVYREVNAIRSEMDSNMPALLSLTDGSTPTEKTATIPATDVKNGKVVRLRLHYGSPKYTPDEKDVFFGGACKDDFSDVRFFDGDGNMLKASFGKVFDIEPYVDTRIGNDNILVTSDGFIIRPYNGGVGISKNNAESFSLIPNTANVTEHGSDVYNRKGIYPLMLDSSDNLYGYAGGKLYKLLASDDYATINEVLDFSWTNSDGDTVYPDVQNHAMDIDIDGNIYIGTYAKTKYFHVDVFVSTNGGSSFTKKYFTDESLTGYAQQHVHHIHADKYSSKVYVGIDGGYYPQGPVVIVTDDAGETWEEIQTRLKLSRGHDYYPTYFGTTYRLGGGENYALGGNALIRGNVDDTEFKTVIKGASGIRNIADFGNDDVIVAGAQRNNYFSENQILVSHDKGLSWDCVLRYDTESFNSSGDGLRVLCPSVVPLDGESEPCILMSGGTFIPSIRLYNGSNHRYREVEVLIENAVDGEDFDIVAKTGYLIPYPYKSVRGFDIEPAYGIKFDEGCGNYIQDSNGQIVNAGNVEWDANEEPVKMGEYAAADTYRPFAFSSAAKINGGVNFGVIPSLAFSYDYSISFWCNEKNRNGNYDESQRYERSFIRDNIVHVLASFGNVELFKYNELYGIKKRGEPIKDGYYIMTGLQGELMCCSDNYYHLTLVVHSDNRISVYVNGREYNSSTSRPWSEYKDVLLSEADFVYGGDTNPIGFISDFRVYDKALTASEVLDIYKGFNY